MQERILKKKRVLVRPNLAWAMSGLNYLETDCLPSHNGSIMNLKEYSCFFISSFQRCIFLELFHKISQKTCFMKMRMLLQKKKYPIVKVLRGNWKLVGVWWKLLGTCWKLFGVYQRVYWKLLGVHWKSVSSGTFKHIYKLGMTQGVQKNMNKLDNKQAFLSIHWNIYVKS